MNRKTKLVLWALPLFVLIVALVGMRWKLEHPTPTQFDLQVRSGFVQAQDAVIYSGLFSNKPCSHPLSHAEREEIAAHLWIETTSASSSGQSVVLIWNFKGEVEVINLSSDWKHGHYLHVLKGSSPVQGVHPATILFLHQWLNEHPQIEKQLGLK